MEELGPDPNLEKFIFPIMHFDSSHESFECLGTGFFIHPDGWFITARHIMVKGQSYLDNSVFAIQTITGPERHVRHITYMHVHPKADIVLGKLGPSHNINFKRIETQPGIACKLFTQQLTPGDSLISAGYPNTRNEVAGTLSTYHYRYKIYQGNITDFHPEKGYRVNNRCYQTTLDFKGGSSGGPVFFKDAVMGIHSSSFELIAGEEPISFITPIDFALGLTIQNEDGEEHSLARVLHLVDLK